MSARRDKLLVDPGEGATLGRAPRLDDALTRRVNADPETVERGLAQLVLTIVELLRQLMERQALHRVEADPENVERGLAQLVLTIVELLRQLMERQALRRVESGTLDENQIERLGRTLMLLERRMEELTEEFGLTAEDLNLNLGPLGDLL